MTFEELLPDWQWLVVGAIIGVALIAAIVMAGRRKGDDNSCNGCPLADDCTGKYKKRSHNCHK